MNVLTDTFSHTVRHDDDCSNARLSKLLDSGRLCSDYSNRRAPGETIKCWTSEQDKVVVACSCFQNRPGIENAMVRVPKLRGKGARRLARFMRGNLHE